MLDSVTPPSLLAPHEQRPATFTPLQMLMASPDAASSLLQSIPVAGDRLVRGWRVSDLLVWREHGHLAWWLRERTIRHRVLVLTDEQITMRNGDRFDLNFNRIAVPQWQWGSPAHAVDRRLQRGQELVHRVQTAVFTRAPTGRRPRHGSCHRAGADNGARRPLRDLPGGDPRRDGPGRRGLAIRGNPLGRHDVGQAGALRKPGGPA